MNMPPLNIPPSQAEQNYLCNGGQTYIPLQENTHVPQVKYTPAAPAKGDLKEPRLLPEYAEHNWQILCEANHFLPGVTAEMLDWFWGNMEKCYYLWAPGSHKLFTWINPPWKVGFVGSSHCISESMFEFGPAHTVEGANGPVRLDMDLYMLEDAMEHVIMEGTISPDKASGSVNIHMWENVEGGCNHRTLLVFTPDSMEGAMDLSVLQDPTHNPFQHSDYEASQWPVFLPKLYDVWKDHPDPAQNYRCDLSVKQNVDGSWSYVAENPPVNPNA